MNNESIESKYYMLDSGDITRRYIDMLTLELISNPVSLSIGQSELTSVHDPDWQKILSDYVADINNVSETEASLIELSGEFNQLIERGLNILEFSNKRREYLNKRS